jgi:mono/diheme cytochrome c family protein
MMRIVIALVVLAFASVAQADGAETYSKKCAGCHGKDGGGGGMYKQPIKGMAEADVLKAIKEGKGKMKPIAIEDGADVAKFVAGLK